LFIKYLIQFRSTLRPARFRPLTVVPTENRKPFSHFRRNKFLRPDLKRFPQPRCRSSRSLALLPARRTSASAFGMSMWGSATLDTNAVKTLPGKRRGSPAARSDLRSGYCWRARAILSWLMSTPMISSPGRMRSARGGFPVPQPRSKTLHIRAAPGRPKYKNHLSACQRVTTVQLQFDRDSYQGTPSRGCEKSTERLQFRGTTAVPWKSGPSGPRKSTVINRGFSRCGRLW